MLLGLQYGPVHCGYGSKQYQAGALAGFPGLDPAEGNDGRRNLCKLPCLVRR